LDSSDQGRRFCRPRVGNSTAPVVVWLRIGNCTNRVLFSWLEPFLPVIQSRLSQGEKIIEIR
jgi:predicted nuclease of predicted toxin-antitoxin system